MVLVDGVYDDAYTAAKAEVEATGAVFVHPFNDEDVIAGQGTIGLELLEELPDMEGVVIPIGGGGLASGIAYTLKQLNPKIKIYGVQACGAPSMANSMVQKCKTTLDRVSTFADGIAVREPGNLTFDLCEKYVDEIVTVTDDEIATAILSLMENEKLVAEGAGVVSVAAVLLIKLQLRIKVGLSGLGRKH